MKRELADEPAIPAWRYGRKVLPIALALLLVAGGFVIFSTPFSSGQSVGLAIDGSNLVDPNAQTTSTTIPLTTTDTNDIIMTCVSTTNYCTGSGFAPPTAKSVKDSAALTWTQGGVTPEPIGSIGWRSGPR